MKLSAALCLALTLAACGHREVPTSEENRQLDEADRLLNEAPANLDAIDDSGLAANDAAAEPQPIAGPSEGSR
jgi:hypothetical protein